MGTATNSNNACTKYHRTATATFLCMPEVAARAGRRKIRSGEALARRAHSSARPWKFMATLIVKYMVRVLETAARAIWQGTVGEALGRRAYSRAAPPASH
eukprot:341118-Alexandrium_andersonii.AAC.1